MKTRNAARLLAMNHILENWTIDGDEPVILDNETIERHFGWIFFYDSLRHQSTGDFRDSILGNAPLIVDKIDGSVHITGTVHTIDHYIDQYEISRNA